MDCELNRKSIFSGFSERYSYSLHYYEAGQFAHLSREWILVSPAGLAASPSPRTPRRTADRHRPCPPRRTSHWWSSQTPEHTKPLSGHYLVNYVIMRPLFPTNDLVMRSATSWPRPDYTEHRGRRTQSQTRWWCDKNRHKSYFFRQISHDKYEIFFWKILFLYFVFPSFVLVWERLRSTQNLT